MSTPFVNRPDRVAKTLYNLGTGVTAKKGNIECGVTYDAYLAKKYTAHQGVLKLRVTF
ncbi:MAG: autotransporter outer membrane beta-barrel domain-containing protein [Candidatus Rickettsia vulgarisii]